MKKSTLSAGLLAAGTLSFGAIAPAHAFSGCTGGLTGMFSAGEINSGTTCIIEDKTYSNFSYSATKLNPGSSVYVGTNTADVFQFAVSGTGNISHSLSVQSGAGGFRNAVVTLSYTVTRNSGTNTFDYYNGNITGDNGTTWTMSLAATNAPMSPATTMFYPTMAQGAVTNSKYFSSNTFTSTFTSVLSADASGFGVTQFANRLIQAPPPSGVPGPLPIIGAGAAFGFSRKLRSRMKLAA